MAANSQFGLPGSIFISAFFCSFISACWARRFSRFSFNRSTSFTTYDRRPVALVAVVCMTGAGAGGGGAGWTIDILDVFRIDDVFDVGNCDCGGIFSMWSPLAVWFAVDLAVRLPAQMVHKKNRTMTYSIQQYNGWLVRIACDDNTQPRSKQRKKKAREKRNRMFVNFVTHNTTIKFLLEMTTANSLEFQTTID